MNSTMSDTVDIFLYGLGAYVLTPAFFITFWATQGLRYSKFVLRAWLHANWYNTIRIGSFYAFILNRTNRVRLTVLARSNYEAVKEHV